MEVLRALYVCAAWRTLHMLRILCLSRSARGSIPRPRDCESRRANYETTSKGRFARSKIARRHSESASTHDVRRGFAETKANSGILCARKRRKERTRGREREGLAPCLAGAAEKMRAQGQQKSEAAQNTAASSTGRPNPKEVARIQKKCWLFSP